MSPDDTVRPSAAGEFVHLQRRGSVAIVSLRRPPVNAIEYQLATDLTDVLRTARDDDAIRAVVLTGTGAFFSAGVDLKVYPTLDSRRRSELLNAVSRMLVVLYGLEVPTVAAVNGHAVAAGTLITLACDYAIAPEGPCQFGLTGVKVGIPYPAAAMAVIRAELAPSDRRVLLLTARTIESSEAQRRGIVDERQPPDRVLRRALEVAAELAALPPEAFGTTKRQLRALTVEGMEAALRKGGG